MDQIGKVVFSVLPKEMKIKDSINKSWLSKNCNDVQKMKQLEWTFILNTLIECQSKLECAYGICSWINPAIDIAKERMKEEG